MVIKKKKYNLPHARERVVVLVKPDGVMRGLVGEIISRFEKRGLKLIALKMVKPTYEHIDEHYPKEAAWIERLGHKGLKTFAEYGMDPKKAMGTEDPKKIGKSVREWLVDYMLEAPIVAMIFQGYHAVSVGRKISGSTLPIFAEIGTIRGDYSIDSPSVANIVGRCIYNIVHVSETPKEAEYEVEHWFSPEEIFDYKRADHSVMFGEE